MSISIDNHSNLYDVTIYNDVIQTLVTHTPSMVDSWIADVKAKRTHRHRLIVGLDVEWLPNRFTESPPATVQLCVGGRCLIFQLLYSRIIPPSLVDFLRNVDYKFTGVKIEEDADKLWRFHHLKVVNVVDLRDLAVEKLGREELGRAGLATLAREVLGKEIEKAKEISLSRWNNKQLSDDQVKYACVDAFLSFEIGRSLYEIGRRSSSFSSWEEFEADEDDDAHATGSGGSSRFYQISCWEVDADADADADA